VFHRLNLFSEGLDAATCNATMFWFSFMIVLLEYLLIFTLVVWFVIDVVIVWRRKTLIGQTTTPTPTPTPTAVTTAAATTPTSAQTATASTTNQNENSLA
jgi:hypothetical protein